MHFNVPEVRGPPPAKVLRSLSLVSFSSIGASVVGKFPARSVDGQDLLLPPCRQALAPRGSQASEGIPGVTVTPDFTMRHQGVLSSLVLMAQLLRLRCEAIIRLDMTGNRITPFGPSTSTRRQYLFSTNLQALLPAPVYSFPQSA